jgi:hypothetical protein
MRTDTAGEYGHIGEGVWMLRSQHPSIHVEQLALHPLRLRMLALTIEGCRESARSGEPILLSEG